MSRSFPLWAAMKHWTRRLFFPAASLAAALTLCQCQSASSVHDADVVVSVKDQKLGFYRNGHLVHSYKVSTSKFGLGDGMGSCRTPLGNHEVIAKIGHGLPKGAVLKSRQWNGEVLKPDAPGRDPVVSRIMWLTGLDRDNHNAYRRFIYIHGTTEEKLLGRPASYGCVRMSMGDVIDLFNQVDIGAHVVITQEKLPPSEPMLASASSKPAPVAPASSNPPIELPSTPTSNAPGELHSEYSPGHSRSVSTQHNVSSETMPSGKQRLLIPVGHSLGESDARTKASRLHAKGKAEHAVTLKHDKKDGEGRTSKKHKKASAA